MLSILLIVCVYDLPTDTSIGSLKLIIFIQVRFNLYGAAARIYVYSCIGSFTSARSCN